MAGSCVEWTFVALPFRLTYFQQTHCGRCFKQSGALAMIASTSVTGCAVFMRPPRSDAGACENLIRRRERRLAVGRIGLDLLRRGGPAVDDGLVRVGERREEPVERLPARGDTPANSQVLKVNAVETLAAPAPQR